MARETPRAPLEGRNGDANSGGAWRQTKGEGVEERRSSEVGNGLILAGRKSEERACALGDRIYNSYRRCALPDLFIELLIAYPRY